MTDELIVRARQNCCRLCLAPDSECVPILNGFAADKEPLLNKIYSCVNIKVSKADNLSLHICHFCVSYLNAWQSFKNRCIAAQKKQTNWLDNTLRTVQKQIDDIRAARQNEENNPLPLTTIHQTTHSTPILKSKLMPIQIKVEPVSSYEDDNNECMKDDAIDPTQFLARNEDEDNEELKRLAANQNLTITKSGGNNDPSGGPSILTSLGLTSVMPFNFLSTELGHDLNQTSNNNNNNSNNNNNNNNINNNTSTDGRATPTMSPDNESSFVKSGACRVCKLRFSTRANARRHERNIHGRALLQNSAAASVPSSTSSNMPNPSNTLNKNNIPHHVDPITPEMLGIYEYDKPEKYRKLLTERVIAFLEDHGDFLSQYQNLTCKCCAKEYPTYKNFMAHMRKKYPLLPRNTCFKCIEQFETKATFVSHVRRRSCINYYKLYINDDTIVKQSKTIVSPEKLRAKELLTNKLYECKICPKKFRLKLEFRSHVYDDHSEIQKKDVLPGHCAFCGLEIEDPIERKRHYNNMECIVYLRCGTCDEKFDNHTKFLDHVYAEHLPKHLANNNELKNLSIESNSQPNQSTHSANKADNPKPRNAPPPTFHSRMPQSCKICGQHYNNYNNVLRHMESKHPDQLPQTYKCALCNAGFPRLSNLRDHMQDIHSTKLAKPKREMGIYCRVCMKRFQDKNNWIMHQHEQHSRFVCCVCNFQSKLYDQFKEHIDGHTSLSTRRVPNNNSNLSEAASKSYAGRYDYVMKDLLSITNGGNEGDDENDDKELQQQPAPKRMKLEQCVVPAKAECKICHAVFNSNLGLSNHMRAHNAQQEAKRAALAAGRVETVSSSSPKKEVISKPIRNTQVLAVERRFRRMRCRLCQKRFSTKKIYRRHMLIEHQIRNVQFIHCAICKAEFAHEKGLKVHMIKVHGKVLKDIGAMNLQFECDICSTVYRTEEQLMAHKKTVHGLSEGMEVMEQYDQSALASSRSAVPLTRPNIPPHQSTSYWFQCRYCASNFDTNKKLAIHINCHDEFDSNDYSCKDCGNVYSGRKSLWVHRYKKHPLVADPALCEICHKTFFDRNMLEHHLLHSHKQKPTGHAAAATGSGSIKLDHDDKESKFNIDEDSQLISSEDDDHEDEEDSDECGGDEDGVRERIVHVSGDDVQTVAMIGLPQVPCSVCGQKFSDQELFTKHIQMHEMMLYTDNPLASMFDTEPEDPDTFLANRVNENGDFMCDICPKTFSQLTALKVHRNWHFRSDGKQIPADPNTVWRSTAKKRKNPSASLKCQFCQSSFISANNLKRHVAELHRRETAPAKDLPDIILEKPLECTKCSMKFKTNAEWVEHKLADAKIGKPNAPFEWGCEICGKVVSRKERLIQHMTAHIKDNEPNGDINADGSPSERRQIATSSSGAEKSENGFDSDSDDGLLSCSSSNTSRHRVPTKSSVNEDNVDKENHPNNSKSNPNSDRDDDSDGEDGGGDHDHDHDNDDHIAGDADNENDELIDTNGEDDDNDDDEEDNDEDDLADDEHHSDISESLNGDDYDSNDDKDNQENNMDEEDEAALNDSGPHSCDLCQLYFETSKQLRKHVASHFVNGPSDTPPAISIINLPARDVDKIKSINATKSDHINMTDVNIKPVIKVEEKFVTDDDDCSINDIEVVKEEYVHDGYEEVEEDGEVIMVPPI